MVKRIRFRGKPVKRLGFEDRQLIELGIREGWETRRIAEQLGRWSPGINSEIKKNGGREAYTAVLGQARYEQATKEGAKRASKERLKKMESPAYRHTTQRIDALEMQIEILFEKLREVENKTV